MSRSPDANRSPVSRATLVLLCACFVLSGVAALIYQTAWTRQFAIVFGTSELAVATVLAAYMGGLALGAWLAERFLPRVTRPVFTYAVLELGIAGSAVFAVPALLWVANVALQAFFGNQPTPPDSDHAATTLFYLLSAFVALALPTTLMGATLPMLARYAVAEESQIGRRIGLLYAMNTAGAVLGALLTAFALLPELGLARTIWVAAALNGLVFLLAVMLAKRVAVKPEARGYSVDGNVEPVLGDNISPPPPPAPSPLLRPRTPLFASFPGVGLVLPLMLFAGAVAFFQEVLWSRMLSHVVGSSVYAFGVMVASFLTGIALGGGVGAAIARRRESAATALAIALIVAAAAAAVAYLYLEELLPTRAGLLQNSVSILGLFSVPLNALFSGLLLLPMTIAIGMTYPLAVRVLARDADDAGPASARVYSWNTVGAIVGSLGAGFVLIPALKYEGAIRVAVCASALLGVAAAWILLPLNTVNRKLFGAIATVAAAVGCLMFQPQPPMRLLVTSPLNVGTQARVLYYDVGRSASVVMLSQDGGLALRTNGLPEALMETPGSLARFSGEYWLSPLAVLARPDTRNMLIVGFGGGVVVEGVPPSVEHVDVIELEPKVIEANQATKQLRKRNPMDDPRVNTIVNDARGALRLTSKKYDAIVSQPSHPWTAGASHLYTREFMQMARDHLNPGGVFVQWMNVIFMDEELMRSLTGTLLSVFPEVRVYRPDPNTVVFLASELPLNVEQHLAETGLPLRNAPLHYSRFGINCLEDLVSALVLETDGARRLAAGATLITDDDNRIATSNVFEKTSGMTGESSGRLLSALDPLQRADSIVYRQLGSSLSFPYLARRNGMLLMLDPSLADRMGRMVQILGPGAAGEYVRAFYYRAIQQTQRSLELLRLAIDENPGDDALREEYLRAYYGALASDQATPEIVEIARGLNPRPAAVLLAARHAVKNEWREVALMDHELAQIPWTDAWYGETLDLRVNWRLRVTNANERRRFADEALTLLDRLTAISPTLTLYGLRARAGLSAERPEVVVESLSNYARLALAMVRAGMNTPESVQPEARALQQILDSVASRPSLDAARVGEVRAEIAQLLPR
ncbi:MAG TPA: fused MFS/spermidine synthase [Steroidobacteraceae bacterium]|nr:fused MFS/spermidine synthase [Steroidobacteraceae bacterium]